MHRNKVRFGVESLKNLYAENEMKNSSSENNDNENNMTSIRKIDSGLNYNDENNLNNNNNNNNNTVVHMGDDATNELVFAVNVSDSCYNGSNSNSSNSEIIDC